MSRQQPGPPKRVPSAPIPPNARKTSQPIQPGPAGTSAGRGGSPAPKFYNGPTVSKTEGIPDYSKDLAKKTVASAKVQTKKAVAVARRHPWSIASLITTIPFLVIISLFSTVVCPPPNSPGTISKYVLSPLGLSHPAPHGSLHQTLCYPANVYNAEVLEPYVYPLIDRAQERVLNHPVYVKGVEPAYTRVKTSGEKVWSGPVRPVVNRIQREVRRAYLTFVQPHIPYLKTKLHTVTAPYTSRVAALHNQYLHPQIAAAQLYANSAKDQTVKSYKYAASHPVTGHAGRYANLGYQVGKKRSIEAYSYSKPHVIRGAKEAERIAREILGPRVIKGLEAAGHQAAKGYGFTKGRVVALYDAHLDPHVGPHIRQMSKTAAPHVERFNQKVYRPYIRPALEAILPQFLFTPEPPRTFWAMIADFLPTAGNHAAERKGYMDDGYSRVKSKTAEVMGKVQASTASVKSSASASASPSASKSVSKAAAAASASASKADVKQHKLNRAEMEQLRDKLKAQIEDQGKKGYKQVKSELAALHKDILATRFPMLQQGSRAEIEQDINYVVTGLDKLYSKSTKLTKDQVSKSSSQADNKIQTKATKVKAKLDGLKNDWFEAGRPIVRKAFTPLDTLLVEKDQLLEEMAWVDDVNPKDFTKLNQLQLNVDGWKDKYMGLHNGSIKDRQLSDPKVNIDKNVADLFTEMDDMIEGFRARVGISKRTALDRIEARSALASESASSTASKSSSTGSGRVSILPIAAEAAGVAGVGAVIGKGKQQVEDALNQASQAVVGSSSTGTGPIQQARSIAEDVASSASSAVHDATRSVISAAGYTPSPEGVQEHVESVYQAAGNQVQSVVEAISEGVHHATRSVGSAVGISQSADGAAEYLESIAAGAQQGAASVYAQAESVIYEATRSVVSAVGATPSPEGVVEHAQSVAAAASSSASSVGSVVSEAVESATRSVISVVGGTPSPDNIVEHAQSLGAAASASASSIGSIASRAVHDGTRSAISAVGGTPSPESVGDYISAASASASSIGSVVSEAVHQGTDSAISAIPNLPSVSASAQSVVADASSSASSIGSIVSEAIHSGTRSIISIVGGTPTPETPKEQLDSLLHAGSAQVDDATEALASMVQSISALLAPVPSPTPAPVAAYLAAISSKGVSAGNELLSSGSSILASLSTELHTATRSLAKAVGATASPEGVQEVLEDVVRKAGEVGEDVKEGLKKVVGRDEL